MLVNYSKLVLQNQNKMLLYKKYELHEEVETCRSKINEIKLYKTYYQTNFNFAASLVNDGFSLIN